MITIFAFISKLLTLELDPKPQFLKHEYRGQYSLTLWRQWWYHSGQNGFMLHNLPSSFHIWSQIEAIMCQITILKLGRCVRNWWHIIQSYMSNVSDFSNFIRLLTDAIAITGLHDRECNPVTPVECVSLSFRTHSCGSTFITHILCINGVEMALVWLIWYTFSYISLNFAICFIALMNLGETCRLKRCDIVRIPNI